MDEKKVRYWRRAAPRAAKCARQMRTYLPPFQARRQREEAEDRAAEERAEAKLQEELRAEAQAKTAASGVWGDAAESGAPQEESTVDGGPGAGQSARHKTKAEGVRRPLQPPGGHSSLGERAFGSPPRATAGGDAAPMQTPMTAPGASAGVPGATPGSFTRFRVRPEDLEPAERAEMERRARAQAEMQHALQIQVRGELRR